MKIHCFFFLFTAFFFIPVFPGAAQTLSMDYDTGIRPGSWQLNEYLSLLKGKNIALVANQTSMVGNTHLADTLLSLKIKVKKVFAPEHGFRGDAGAGENVRNGVDEKTKLPVISLYGSKLKPSMTDLSDIDMVVFDIQDVGVRFYTYIATLQYVMEACAEKKIPFIVLDRPNPNGFYIDGPVLEKKFSSFVGLNPVPVVYGLTIGEYAGMINGEHWLANGSMCDLKVIKTAGYDHTKFYALPVRPSPNLPDMASVYLYPSLCFFEGTMVSVGRGTSAPFQVIGYPGFEKGSMRFTPVSMEGIAKNPPYEGIECSGINLKEFAEMYLRDYKGIYLFWLRSLYQAAPDKKSFFNDFFNKLAGNESLQQQIKDGLPEEAIKLSWKKGLDDYKQMRKKYVLYRDFE